MLTSYLRTQSASGAALGQLDHMLVVAEQWVDMFRSKDTCVLVEECPHVRYWDSTHVCKVFLWPVLEKMKKKKIHASTEAHFHHVMGVFIATWGLETWKDIVRLTVSSPVVQHTSKASFEALLKRRRTMLEGLRGVLDGCTLAECIMPMVQTPEFYSRRAEVRQRRAAMKQQQMLEQDAVDALVMSASQTSCPNANPVPVPVPSPAAAEDVEMEMSTGPVEVGKKRKMTAAILFPDHGLVIDRCRSLTPPPRTRIKRRWTSAGPTSPQKTPQNSI